MFDRLKASAVHLCLSAIVIGSFLLLVYQVWYPYPLYITEGLSHIAIILLGVDLVLGPVLTLILFKKGKKYLLFDLSIIVAIQFSAFIYGAITIAEGRPIYIVFAKDVFKTVSPSMIDMSTLKNKELEYKLFKPPVYIYATTPKDPEELQRLMWTTLSGGKDIEQLPKYYQDYKTNLAKVRIRNRTYQKKLHQNPKLKQLLTKIQREHALTKEQTGLYPFFGHEKAVIAVIDLNNGNILDLIETLP